MGLGLHGPISAAQFAEFETFYRKRDVLPGLSLCPLADPSLVHLLGEGSYRIELFMDVWFRELGGEEWPIDDGRLTMDGIVIEPIGLAEADVWVQTALDNDIVAADKTAIICRLSVHAEHDLLSGLARRCAGWRRDVGIS